MVTIRQAAPLFAGAPTVAMTVADLNAPTSPVLTATPISSSQIDLSWTAASDTSGLTQSGVSSYKLRRGGSLIATVNAPTTTYENTGLTASTGYSYTVAAVDAAGNESAQSATATATTSAATSGWPAQDAVSYLPIVPGARGFGMETTAGTARTTSLLPGQGTNSVNAGTPTILFVTSLSDTNTGTLTGDTGTGTLRWCCQGFSDGGANVPGARLVIPLVSGVIVGSGAAILIAPNTMVAFQCAPDPGLHLFQVPMRQKGSNIVLWHCSSFYSKEGASSDGSAYWPVIFGGGAHWDNHIFANCSTLWNAAEGFAEFGSLAGTRDYTTDTTYWNCLAANGSGEYRIQANGVFGLGKSGISIWSSKTMAWLRCALLHNYERNPMTASPNFSIADSLVYNYGQFGTEIRRRTDSVTAGEAVRVNVEANIYLTGPNTGQYGDAGPLGIYDSATGLSVTLHYRGNASVGHSIVAATGSRITSAMPAGYVPLEMTFTGGANVSNAAVADVKNKGDLILATAGPRPKSGKRLPVIQSEIDTATARLNGAGSGLGSWRWLSTQIERYPLLSDIGTVAQNSISVNDATRTDGNDYWNGDPVPLAQRSAVDATTNYSMLELWLHRRNAEVMP